MLGNDARKVIWSQKVPHVLRNFDLILEVPGGLLKMFKWLVDMI